MLTESENNFAMHYQWDSETHLKSLQTLAIQTINAIRA